MDRGFSTTFKMDFTIADAFGIKAIKDTYKRAFKEWKTEYQYLTDLVICLNNKLWEHYTKGNEEYAKVYDAMWRESYDYALDHFKGEQFQYFYDLTN